MNIKEAKNEIKHTLLAYLRKNEKGGYIYPLVRQRPILLMGPPGIGKTAIMEQIAEECQVGLVAYTITHHTRQSAVGLPKIVTRNYGGKEMDITEYTMSEIIASVYECMEHTAKKKESFLWMRSTVCPRHWRLPCSSFCRTKPSEPIKCRRGGSLWQQAILLSTTSLSGSLTL